MLYFFDECFGGVVEEEVGFVEEEDKFGFIEVTDFGELFEEFAEEPEEEGGIEAGVLHQLVAGEDADVAFSVLGGAHEVSEFEGGFAEEVLGALLFKDEEGALDGSDGG